MTAYEGVMRNRVGRLVSMILLLQAGAGFGMAGAAEVTPASATAAARLAEVDKLFFQSYEGAVHEVLPDPPPAFLVLPDRLVLYRHGTRQEWPLLPPLFNELKTVSHVTLGLFAILSPLNGGALAAADVNSLRQYQDLMATTRGALAEIGLSAEQRARQEQILAASATLAARALADGRMAEADLTAFCRQMRPLVDANIGEAVRAYLDELNRRMTAALPQLDAAERADYLVIVTGVHQARIDNAAMQYFNRLMHSPPVIAQRLMYAENVYDETGTLHLLGIHRMARRVGVAYFDDPDHMNRDLFAPAAEAYVPTMQLPP